MWSIISSWIYFPKKNLIYFKKMPINYSTDKLNTNHPLIEFKNVTFSYSGRQNRLLENISFTLSLGQKIGIVGDNGSGKSTILKLLLGLYSPNQGIVKLFGQEVLWGNHYPRLGYIGDPSYNPGELGLPTGILVKEIVESFKALLESEKNDLSYLEIEEKLKIPKFYNCDVGKLSKGQRMRLMAFLALGKKIDLLVADEATEGLDKEGKETVLSEIKRLADSQNFGILWISHRRDEVAMLTNEVYELLEGKLLKHCLQGFSCQIETNSLEGTANNYINVGKDEAFEILGKVFTEQSISNFKMTGFKSQE